ncbi:GNAT family N-acetyltransferase [Flavobacteriaceae bacterium]|nr:GNAT family N-acetyltransferase [Flavobacteriaceae bacterium]MDB2633025.1 GNAT family N-acetyltransferase [Flavobacteriaceae bacterium]MDB2684546.1 GNAT family N-acetyltransferase [Flavobacteriaceae bacterium]MDB4256764.1 GNAT family N-acetyltransferase [Flavobacteriaceae bacterium]MDC0331420.1 GNAT family N-acetyltransferase [Flavobacteriaceae bacterium]
MTYFIETKNLILRDFRDTDVTSIFQLDSNREVHEYLGKKPIKTIKEAEEIVSFFHQQYKERGIGRFATIEKSSGKFIGWVGLKLNLGEKEMLNGYTNFIDIGYRLLPSFWGKGYATEASLASIKYGFKNLKYNIIYGAADIENIASNKVLQKIGLNFINEFAFKNVKCNWYELKKENYEY